MGWGLLGWGKSVKSSVWGVWKCASFAKSRVQVSRLMLVDKLFSMLVYWVLMERISFVGFVSGWLAAAFLAVYCT